MNLKRANRKLSAILRRTYSALYRDPAALVWLAEAERLQVQLRYRYRQQQRGVAAPDAAT